jgi:hypothetical protein
MFFSGKYCVTFDDISKITYEQMHGEASCRENILTISMFNNGSL